MEEALRLLGWEARAAGLDLGADAHYKRPEVKNGEQTIGGPDFPGRKLPRVLPHLFDVVVRRESDPDRWPWPACYRCEGPRDPRHYTKDRHDVLTPGWSKGAANMRELLRAAGYHLPRLAGLDWQDTVADRTADLIRGGKTPREAWAAVVEKLAKANLHPLHVRWALQDGIARAEYAARPSPLDLPTMSPAVGAAGGVNLT
jgi:hypothetical protein